MCHKQPPSVWSQAEALGRQDSTRGRVYRCEATSLEGFIQQIAVAYITHGYYFYVSGFVPEGKDPTAVDAKLIERYGIGISKWARARRKEQGIASLQYIRFDRQFVILATHGRHPFFEHEATAIRDFRRTPLRVAGYSVSCRGGHAHVRIDLPDYRRLKAHLVELARHRSVERLAAEFSRIPFEPYAPVRRQLFNILRAVNRVRKHAGFERLVVERAVRMRRRVVRVFDDSQAVQAA